MSKSRHTATQTVKPSNADAPILHTDMWVDWKLIRHIHLPPACTNTHSKTCKTVENTCGSALSNRIKTAFFVWNPQVVASPCAVTAHQSSIGGESFDYLLHVTACVCSFREALVPGPASQPPLTPPLLILPIPQGNSALDPDSDLMLPSCFARTHTCTYLTCMHLHTDYFHPLLSLLTF